MKPLTYQQKKWAMTSALMMVLGFNVSFNSHTNGIAAMDLSSLTPENVYNDEVVIGQIATTIGVANIKYLKNGDHTTTALVPRKNTEGTAYCETCGYDSYRLNLDLDKFKNDIQAVNVALLQRTVEVQKEEAANKTGTHKSTDKATDKAAKEGVAEKEESEVDEKYAKTQYTEDKLAEIEKRCNREDSKSECLLAQITNLLKRDRRTNKIDEATVKDFVKKTVTSQMKKEMNDTIIQAAIVQEVQTRNQLRIPYDERLTTLISSVGEDNLASAMEKRQNMVTSISKFIESVPNQFESVRGELIKNERSIIDAQAESFIAQRVRASIAAEKNQISLIFPDSSAGMLAINSLQKTMSKMGYESIATANDIDPINRMVFTQYSDRINALLSPIDANSIILLNQNSNTNNGITTNNMIQFPNSIADRFNTNRGFTTAPVVTIQSINQQIGTPAGTLNNNYQPQKQFQPNFEARTGRGF